MKPARIRLAVVSAALALAAVATPAAAEWRWVEDEPGGTVQVYQEPRGPGYYQERETYRQKRETYRREYEAPYVTNTEVFHDGSCEVTRTYLSDGSATDERVCRRVHLVPPHVFVIDRIGRHFDRLRAHHDYHYRH